MPRILLDENVSLEVAFRLERKGYQILAVTKLSGRGMDDEEIYRLALEEPTILVTRDHHFTNNLRFPPEATAGILYVTHGNLRAYEEADLVEAFFQTHPEESFKGRLVFLTRTSTRIR